MPWLVVNSERRRLPMISSRRWVCITVRLTGTRTLLLVDWRDLTAQRSSKLVDAYHSGQDDRLVLLIQSEISKRHVQRGPPEMLIVTIGGGEKGGEYRHCTTTAVKQQDRQRKWHYSKKEGTPGNTNTDLHCYFKAL